MERNGFIITQKTETMSPWFRRKKELSRKEKNELFLRKKGIKINSNLPPTETESETTIRSAKEIAERVVALATVNLVAFEEMSGEQAIEYLTKYDVFRLLTPTEKSFLENPTEEKRIQETWKSESIWVLMWALGFVEELNTPDRLCDLNAIPGEKYPIGEERDPNDFITSIQEAISKKEIMDFGDLYYRMNWACVDARINNRPIKGLHPGVVYERQYALNWLVNYMGQEWDEITCDT